MASDSAPIEGDFSTVLESDTLTVSKQEIIEIHKDLHRSLRETVEELIQPLDKKLENFMTELRDTTQKADANTAKCTSLQEKVNKLQATEAATNTRLLLLENRWRQHNLKFRGFEEGAEENTELYKEKIRFRWSPSSDIIVYKNGAQLLAHDVASGKDLLKACGIEISPEEDKLLDT
ncbi:UNVERIFIED_CONTAM: hypothetical protein K2H54_044559 [Gekko kuhli]